MLDLNHKVIIDIETIPKDKGKVFQYVNNKNMNMFFFYFIDNN